MKLTATHNDHVVIMSTSHPRQHARIQIHQPRHTESREMNCKQEKQVEKICRFHNHTNNFPSLQATTFAEMSFDWAVAFGFHHELFSVLSNYLFVYTWSVTTCIRSESFANPIRTLFPFFPINFRWATRKLKEEFDLNSITSWLRIHSLSISFGIRFYQEPPFVFYFICQVLTKTGSLFRLVPNQEATQTPLIQWVNYIEIGL